ncbi:formylglycine-generating enzyme family protein [Solimicrobium silvestre]|uniref:Sulfatase-modifying factor enzyme-like domain-containing protein n=1 Tax=Solimicrobium silvestre TaxID=2099400 RepID=A0A2S9GX99_9BURK|nr:formylglycine-generating enzyme family protein [Solimicrobium silvestre]PRC92331.1 hypothetical protein S2091_2990 [Solimicrobium silvestre]
MTINMVKISPIAFKMGSDKYKNERPVRQVNLSGYYIDLFPVTNTRYKKFIESQGYKNRQYWTDDGWDFIHSKKISKPLYWCNTNWNQPNQPVTGVSWWEALAFSRFENKTLPTEAQWEYMASGGVNIYPWGDDTPTLLKANYAEGCEPTDLERRSTNVDHFLHSRSHCGCWDVAGNVGEWCLDNHSENYGWDIEKKNPIFLTKETKAHIVRGGSGLHDDEYLRSTSRDYYAPTIRDNIVGFRCVINME